MDFTTKQEELYKSIVTLTGKTVKAKPFETSDLYAALVEISTGSQFHSKIDELRTIPDIDSRQEYKLKNLPFFTIGKFQDNERKKKALISTNYAIFDFDHLDNNWDEQWKQITADDRVFAAFRSPSGDGIKVIYKFDREVTDYNMYSSLYKHFANELCLDLGDEPDKTSDCSRACYISYDPNLYLNPDAVGLVTDLDLQICSLRSKKVIKKDSSDFLTKLKNGCKANEPRTPVLTEAIGKLIKNGIDREHAIGFALGWNQRNEIPHADDKVIYTVNDLYDRYGNQSISEKTKDFYSYESHVLEAKIIGDEFSVSKIGEKKFYIKMKAYSDNEKNMYLTHLVNNNHIHSLRRIDYISDTSIDTSFYECFINLGLFTAHIAPVPVKVKDNDFIEKYLTELFGTQKKVIKEWLAVYCNTNYRKLPHLIFTGVTQYSKTVINSTQISIIISISVKY